MLKRYYAKTNYRYLGLLQELALTDFKLKYQGSIIGYIWSLAKPLAIFGVLYLVFTVFVRVGADIPHYPVYLLLGIVLWSYFAESTLSAMHSIVDKGDLIRKVYFPRIVILLASSVSALITLLLNLLVVMVFIVIAGINLHLSSLGLIALLAELYMLSLGMSFFLSALFIKYRDFGHIWEVGLQLLFYASPIIYPLSIVPNKFQKLILLSPITQIIQDARFLLVSTDSATSLVKLHWLGLIPYLIPPIIAIAGYLYFNHSASKFAEEV